RHFVALAVRVTDAAFLGRLRREDVLTGRERFAQGGDPFTAGRFRSRGCDFAFAELDVHGDFRVFARRAFEGRAGVVGARFGAFRYRDFRRFGVDFEFDRRFACAFEVADAALLGRVGRELVVAGGQRFAERRDRPFARRGRRL